MTKKLTSLVLALLMLLSFAACTKSEEKEETAAETSAESTSYTEATGNTDPFTAATEEDTSVTEPETETVTEEETSLTEKVTAVASTTAKEIRETVTAVKSTTAVTTTKAATTTAKAATTAASSSSGTISYEVPTSDRYGVVVNKIGSKTTVDRFWYTGTYSELLPYAKRNRNTFDSYIQRIFYLTNQMRAEKGLAPLKLSDKLTEQANVRAEEIAWSGQFLHTRPNGSSFSQLFKENGLTTGTGGENIARGYTDPDEVCAAWKASETHYANIMSEDFVSVGIGVAIDPLPENKLVFVQHFYTKDA